MVNRESQEGRDFIVFKRQLYQMYEVRHRSVHEHEQFSLNVERRNLKWLYEANKDFIQEMNHINQIDQMADHASLKGKVFRAKTMNPRKMKGLLSLGFSGLCYSKLVMLTLMMGPTIPITTVAATALYGMYTFADKEYVSAIESLENGELKLTIQKSALVSYTILTNIKNV
jgi:Holliday junction resolvase-like predicted endonuclease